MAFSENMAMSLIVIAFLLGYHLGNQRGQLIGKWKSEGKID